MNEKLYNVRMRASHRGRHVSGAERIVDLNIIDAVARELVARARDRSPSPDQISVTIESLGDFPIRALKALDLITLGIPDVSSGRSAAIRVLQNTGVSASVAEYAVQLLSKGASPSGEVMRGAIVMDALTGKRLEQHSGRGVRASRFDWDEQCGIVMRQRLADLGLSHFRTFEALALATKVAHAPGAIAELCWSDEKEYTAGYVASLRTGYVRFPALKTSDDPKGGRVFFVDVNQLNLNIETYIRYLQEEPVLIRYAGTCRAVSNVDEYFMIRELD